MHGRQGQTILHITLLLSSLLCFTAFSHGLNAPSISFSQHSVEIELGKSDAVNLSVITPVPSNATFKWFYDGNSNAVQALPIVFANESSASKEVWIKTNLENNTVGEVTLSLKSVGNSSFDLSDAFTRVTVIHSNTISVISAVVGWIYFAAWTVSFYPQLIENWRLKSVVGLSFDFLALNILGFICYAIFNISLYWANVPRQEFRDQNPHELIQVAINDVVFSVHAVIISVLTGVQCFFYEKGGQRVSWAVLFAISASVLAAIILSILSTTSVLTWLDLLYYLSYVKLGVTIIKYMPQAYRNFKRKSTVGWSIYNVLLDFTGGSLSLVQMFLSAYNADDWASILGDPTKFGLGLFSVLFDVLFMVQHYILYRSSRDIRASYEHFSNGNNDEEEDRRISRVDSPDSLSVNENV